MFKFSYIIDDDENRTQDMQAQIDEIAVQTFSPEVVGRNQSTRNTGVQTGDGAVRNPFPLRPSIRIEVDPIGNITFDVDLNRVDSHTLKATINGDITFAFENPPSTLKKIEFTIDITMDGVGGHDLDFPLALNITPAPTPSNSANARTVMNFQTTDGGASYQMTSQIII